MKYIGLRFLRPKLKKDFGAVKKAFKKANKSIESGKYTNAELWLCDNFYIISSEYESTKSELTSEIKLPLEDGKLRILKTAEKTSLQAITKESIKEALSCEKLTFDELYSYFALLRVALFGRLAAACEKISDYPKEAALELECIISGFRFLSSCDREKLISDASHVEKILGKDKYYSDMTDESKAEYKKRISEKARKIGIGESEYAESLIKSAESGTDERSRHIGSYLFNSEKHIFGFLYFVFTAAFAVLFTALFYFPCSYYCILILPAAYELGKRAADYFGSKLCTPTPLFSLELENLPENMRTLTVITALFTDCDGKCFDALEDYYLSNKDKNAVFGILADFSEKNEPFSHDDDKIADYVKGRIESLNLKYGGGFCVFLRNRRYSKSESKYMGWERKRGAVVSLAKILSGEELSDVVFYGDENCIKNIKYVITLDTDTEISAGDVKRMVGYMAHPLQKPLVDESKNIVTKGYGIMQPKMEVSLFPSNKTEFSLIASGGGGMNIYQSASYDSYQELFSEGIFCGKGIFDVEAFMKTVANAFPDETVLSHDILEGTRLRTALICDMTLYDGIPTNAISYFKRAHRWIRGDIQALLFAKRRVPDASGRLVKNPISALSKYKIYDSVRHDITCIFSAAAVIISAFLPKSASAFLTLGALSYMLIPLLYSVFDTLFSGRAALFIRKFYSKAAVGIYRSAEYVFFDICSLIYSAQNALDAAVRGIYRAKFSHKHTLEWTTAAASDKKRPLLSECMEKGLFSAAVGAFVFFVSKSVLTKATGVFFVLFPLFAYFTGRKKLEKSEKPKENELKKIYLWADDMWKFYARFVTAGTSFLPPDNITATSIAMRTSPTNIGFYLASVLCARDFGFINSKTMYNCIKNTIDTVTLLPKWNGHLYNWYDIKTKTVLGRPYVSTVDSGNFIALCTCVMEGIKEYANEVPELAELSVKIDGICKNADFTKLYDTERKLFSLGYDESTDCMDGIYYDLFMSEARLTSYYAVASGQVPVKHWHTLSRRLVNNKNHIGLASWTGTAFEYFMPSLLLEDFENSLIFEGLSHCLAMQRKKSAAGLFGTSESGFYDFDSDMNYGYKAFGVGALALKNGMDKEIVISPYSSFIMLESGMKPCMKNLSLAASKGLYGKFGFYEAADFTADRVGNGVGIVKSYMAHHVGMSLLACDNLVFNGRMKKRFMRNPEMHCARGLLSERIPADAPIIKLKYKEKVPERNAHYIKDTVLTAGADEQKYALVSNNRSRIVARSDGRMGLYNADTCIALAEFSSTPFPESVKFSFSVNGKQYRFENALCEYSSSFVKYKINSDGTDASLTCGVSDSDSLFAFSLELECEEKPDFAEISFMPIMENEELYKNHPAYSKLFVESSYEKESGILTFSKKKIGKESKSSYLSVASSDAEISFRTSEESEKNDMKTGVPIYPHCVFRTKFQKLSENKYTAYFILAFSSSKSDNESDIEKYRAKLSGGISSVISEIDTTVNNCFAVSGINSKDKALSGRVLSALVNRENNFSFSKEMLWRFGISGDRPIVLCEYGENDKELAASLMRIHRFFLIKYMRFDLVFIVDEKEGYLRINTNALVSTAEKIGSKRLVGAKSGIFIIDRRTLSDKEYDNLVSASVMNASEPPASVNAQDMKINTVGDKIEIPDTFPVTSETYGGFFSDDGFVIDRSVKHAPWSYVIASDSFGTVVTEKSLGFTYLFNSQLGLLSKKDSDILRSQNGERLYFEIGGELYDLALCSSYVYFGKGTAIYFGSVCQIEYNISVSVDEKEFVKSYKVSAFGIKDKINLVFVLSTDGKFELSSGLSEYKKSGFLSSYTCFARFENADFQVTESGIFGKKEICDGSHTLYLGAYRTLRHREHLMQITDGRTFSTDYRKFLPKKKLNTGYVSIDLAANIWLPYQTAVCRLLARSGYYQQSGAYGFRDQLQDAANLAYIAPSYLKTHIIRCAARQFFEGDVLHWWHDTEDGIFGIRTKCTDDRLWLVFAVCEYIKATGDKDILNLKIPYITGDALSENESEKCGYYRFTHGDALGNHCIKAIEISTNTGSHGLPEMGSCDWNDAMNNVFGESVFNAFFLKSVMLSFSEYCPTELAQKLKREAERIAESARENAYEYGQYVRAYYKDGTPIGSKLSDECKTDILVQSFAVLSDSEKGDRLERILDTLESAYDEKNGIMPLLSPPFSHTGRYAGYICDYPEGVRENGGQYTHAAMWAVLALYKGGRKKKALDILLRLCPHQNCTDKKRGLLYNIEPYVAAGDVHNSSGNAGRGGWSWYTGAAGWMLRAINTVFYDKTLDNEKK